MGQTLTLDDALLQQVVFIFDHSIAVNEPTCQNEVLIYHLITSFYLVLKVEGNCALTFDAFEELCRGLPEYRMLNVELDPKLEVLSWVLDQIHIY